jgi:hypothetical protein
MLVSVTLTVLMVLPFAALGAPLPFGDPTLFNPFSGDASVFSTPTPALAGKFNPYLELTVPFSANFTFTAGASISISRLMQVIGVQNEARLVLEEASGLANFSFAYVPRGAPGHEIGSWVLRPW